MGVIATKAIENSAIIRNGIDVIYLFELRGDIAEVKRLIEQLELKECVAEEPTTFVMANSPVWWLRNVTDKSTKFEFVNANREIYRSVWFEKSTSQIFVEVGQW